MIPAIWNRWNRCIFVNYLHFSDLGATKGIFRDQISKYSKLLANRRRISTSSIGPRTSAGVEHRKASPTNGQRTVSERLKNGRRTITDAINSGRQTPSDAIASLRRTFSLRTPPTNAVYFETNASNERGQRGFGRSDDKGFSGEPTTQG